MAQRVKHAVPLKSDIFNFFVRHAVHFQYFHVQVTVENFDFVRIIVDSRRELLRREKASLFCSKDMKSLVFGGSHLSWSNISEKMGVMRNILLL